MGLVGGSLEGDGEATLHRQELQPRGAGLKGGGQQEVVGGLHGRAGD